MLRVGSISFWTMKNDCREKKIVYLVELAVRGLSMFPALGDEVTFAVNWQGIVDMRVVSRV